MIPPPEHRRPQWWDEVYAEMLGAFAATGAGTPGWPDPHPDRQPAEDEYSRCLDPEKYRILPARVEAWAEAVTLRGLARVDQPPMTAWIGMPDRDVRTVTRLRPVRETALTLLLATTIVEDRPFGVAVGIKSAIMPPVFLEDVPDCGCDACDSGSDDLLTTLDDLVFTVARGGVVHARSEDSHITRNANGWSAGGTTVRRVRRPGATRGRVALTPLRGSSARRREPAEEWLDEAAEVPAGVERWRGATWI